MNLATDLYPKIIRWCDNGETVINILRTCRVVHLTIGLSDLEFSKARRLLLQKKAAVLALGPWIPKSMAVFEWMLSWVEKPLTDWYVHDDFVKSLAKHNRHDIVAHLFLARRTSMLRCRRKISGQCHDQCGVIGERLLTWAAAYGRLELAETLMRKGVVIHSEAVRFACRGNLPLLELMERSGVDFQDYTLFGSGLCEAVVESNAPAIKYLLERNANVDVYRALVSAVCRENLSVLKMLLRNDGVLLRLRTFTEAHWVNLCCWAELGKEKPVMELILKLKEATRRGVQITSLFIALVDIID